MWWWWWRCSHAYRSRTHHCRRRHRRLHRTHTISIHIALRYDALSSSQKISSHPNEQKRKKKENPHNHPARPLHACTKPERHVKVVWNSSDRENCAIKHLFLFARAEEKNRLHNTHRIWVVILYAMTEENPTKFQWMKANYNWKKKGTHHRLI